MPIRLATPFNPGDLDPGKIYEEAKITSFRCIIEPRKGIEINIQYGNTVDGKWVPGVGGERSFFIHDIPAQTNVAADNTPVVIPADPQYTDMITNAVTITAEGHRVYLGAARTLYQWLIDKGHLAGVLEL